MLALFAIWVLLSGLDDLFLDLAFLYRWLVTVCLERRRIRAPTEAELAGAPRNRIDLCAVVARTQRCPQHDRAQSCGESL